MTVRRMARLAGVAGVLALAALPGCAKPRPTADQVLTRMAEAYRDLNTLRERAKVRVEMSTGGQTTALFTPQLDWAVSKPNKIHYQASHDQPLTVVSDGKQAYTALPLALQCSVMRAPARLSDLPSLHYSTAAVLGLNEFKLLDGLNPGELLDNIRLEPEDSQAGGVWCHVLAGDLLAEGLRIAHAKSGTQRIWVGRDDFLIRRYEVDLRGAKEVPLAAGLPGAEADVIEQREFARVDVVRVEPNVDLEADLFAYALPTGYRLIPDPKGKPFPDISLPDLQGRPVSIASYRGKNVVLAFWASWDQGSVMELEILQAFRDRHPAEHLVVVTVTRDVDLADAQRRLRDGKISLPTLQAGGDLDARVKDLGIVSLPKIFLIDKGGIVRDVISGMAGVPDLEEAARAAGFDL